jgi:transcriptional regulator GlxA family with amidase domain
MPDTTDGTTADFRVAVVTYDGFNELDSFIAAALINRAPGITAHITTPTPAVTSLNGVEIRGQKPLAFAAEADAVLIGSGIRTRDVAAAEALAGTLPLDPARQLVASQCSGALILATLGLLGTMPACTDTTTRPWVEACGVTVLDAPFHAEGNIATAGGCLASQYLAAWVLTRTVGETAARAAIEYAAPVGEKTTYTDHVMAAIAQPEAALR